MMELKILASGDAITEVRLMESPAADILRMLEPAGSVFPIGHLVGQIH